MTKTAATLRAYKGVAILSYGFRPFFLAGSIWAAAAMILFVLMLQGSVSLPCVLSPIDWHLHELLYGFLPAIVAGFLLTAVPNWTGRLPVAGAPLAALFGLWLTGRAAVFCSALIGAGIAASADMLFLIALVIVIGREIIQSKNLHNLRVLVLAGLLATGNFVFHIETAGGGAADYGKRIGIAVAILLISLIGGRVIPSFTRNWLAKRGSQSLPAPFGRFDIATIAASAVALVAWILAPDALMTGAACAIAGLLQTIRLARWKGYRTFAEPLVTVLHAGYVFVPAGFLLLALSLAFPGRVSTVAAVHAWTAGAIGVMTLAVMTRASLGHTGHALTASPAVMAIYTAAAGAALARIAAAFGIEPQTMLHLAAAGWVMAFGGFAVVFGPMLAMPRRR